MVLSGSLLRITKDGREFEILSFQLNLASILLTPRHSASPVFATSLLNWQTFAMFTSFPPPHTHIQIPYVGIFYFKITVPIFLS